MQHMCADAWTINTCAPLYISVQSNAVLTPAAAAICIGKKHYGFDIYSLRLGITYIIIIIVIHTYMYGNSDPYPMVAVCPALWCTLMFDT